MLNPGLCVYVNRALISRQAEHDSEVHGNPLAGAVDQVVRRDTRFDTVRAGACGLAEPVRGSVSGLLGRQ